MKPIIFGVLLLATPAMADQPISHAMQVATDVTYMLEGMTHTPAGQKAVAEMFSMNVPDTESILKAAQFAPF